MASEAHRFLTSIATELRRENAAISRMDSALVERDIAVRRREAALGRRWAGVRSRIRKELESLGVSEAGWCREELGCDIRTMRRRVQLAKGWVQYERARRHAGNNGQFGLVYGLSLIPKPVGSRNERSSLVLSFRKRSGPIGPIALPIRQRGRTDRASQAEVSIGQRRDLFPAVLAIKAVVRRPWHRIRADGFKLHHQSGHCLSRGAAGIKKDGILWVVIGDSYTSAGGKWRQDAYKVNRPQKQLVPVGTWYPGSDLAAGNLMMVPARLALALQDDGWLLRQEIIWDKGWVRQNQRETVSPAPMIPFTCCAKARAFL